MHKIYIATNNLLLMGTFTSFSPSTFNLIYWEKIEFWVLATLRFRVPSSMFREGSKADLPQRTQRHAEEVYNLGEGVVLLKTVLSHRRGRGGTRRKA
jgi:hypothetical protein